MKKLRLLLMISGLILGIVSCNNDADGLVSVNDQAEFTLSVKYKGVNYMVPGKLDESGNPVYLNEEFRDIYQKELSKQPNLVTMILDNNTVEYYDSLNEIFDEEGLRFLEQIAESNVSEVTTRASGTAGFIKVWDDSNYKDRFLDFEVDYTNVREIIHLKYYDNFNDKISAIQMWSYINPSQTINWGFPPMYSYLGSSLRITFIGYEHDSYGGNVLLCLCSAGSTHMDPKLGNFGWNDKITGIRTLITSTTNTGQLQPFWGYLQGYPSIYPYTPH